MSSPTHYPVFDYFSFFRYIDGTLGLRIHTLTSYYCGSVEKGLTYPISLPAFMHDAIEHAFWTETAPCGAD